MDTITAPPAASSRPHLPGPHAHIIDARLTKIEDVARDTKLYTFARVEGGSLPAYKPGSHIDLHLPNGLVRQFSLVVPNNDPDSYVVGVKKDAASRGGSRYIIEEMKVRDQIKISAPRNNFPLIENADHVVLVAGGIGITPIWCMTQQLVALERPWTLYYSCRSREDMAFLDDTEEARPAIRASAFRRRGGRQVSRSLPQPSPRRPRTRTFIAADPIRCLRRSRRPRRAGRAATFTSNISRQRMTLPRAPRLGGFWVELARSGEEYFIPEGKKVLEVLFDAGVDVDYSCELGICGACETRVISGIPIHHDSVLSEEEQATNEKVMICCCGCATERLVLDM